MRKLRMLIVGMAMASVFAAPARADYPRYVILRAPSATTAHGHGYHPGYRQDAPAQAYAWGWFGAGPRSQSVGHSDYYGNTRMWRQ